MVRIKVQIFLIRIIVPLAGIQAICLVCCTIYWSFVRTDLVTRRGVDLCFPKDVQTSFTETNGELENDKGLGGKFKEKHNNVCGRASDVLRYMSYMATQDLFDTAPHPELKAFPHFLNEKCTEIKEQSPFLILSQLDGNQTFHGGQSSNVFWKTASISNIVNHKGLSYNTTTGCVHVEKDGLYFVKSQIRIKLQVGNKQISEDMEHRVNRFSHKEKTSAIILENVRTPCEPATANGHHTSAVGALFFLNAHDQVCVTTSHPEALVTMGTGNHFTIFVL